jgi:hypothetical protein
MRTCRAAAREQTLPLNLPADRSLRSVCTKLTRELALVLTDGSILACFYDEVNSLDGMIHGEVVDEKA